MKRFIIICLVIVLSITLISCSSGVSQVGSDSFDNKNDVIIDCPSTISNNGYTMKLKDAYVKCLNTDSTTYGWDGLFVFISVEFESEDYTHDEYDNYISICFDMYDSNEQYVGNVQALTVFDPSNLTPGTVLNDNAILAADDVCKLVYNPNA